MQSPLQNPPDFNWELQGIILRVTAALSIFGSTWIIAEVLNDERKRSMCYHRIIFALSAFTVLSSIWYFVGMWAQPKEVDGFGPMIQLSRLRHGTQTTCSMSGYSIYLSSLAIPCYNAALAIYFYLAICCRWTEEQIRKKFEGYIHYIIGPISVVLSIIPFMLNEYHTYYSYCFVVSNARNNNQFLTIPDAFMLCTVAAVILSTCIILTTIVLMITSATKEKNLSVLTTTKAGILISVLYATVFLATVVGPVLYMLVVNLGFRTNGQFGIVHLTWRTIFAFEIYLAVFLPLQGFCNWFLYLRPRFQKFRKRTVITSSCTLVKDALFWSCLRSDTAEYYDGDCYLGSGMNNNCERTEDLPEIPEIEDDVLSSLEISKPFSLTSIKAKSMIDVKSDVTFEHYIIRVDGVANADDTWRMRNKQFTRSEDVPSSNNPPKVWDPTDELKSNSLKESLPPLQSSTDKIKPDSNDELLSSLIKSLDLLQDKNGRHNTANIKHVIFTKNRPAKSDPNQIDVSLKKMVSRSRRKKLERPADSLSDDDDEDREQSNNIKYVSYLERIHHNSKPKLPDSSQWKKPDTSKAYLEKIQNKQDSSQWKKPDIISKSSNKKLPNDSKSSDGDSSYGIELQQIAAALPAKW